MTTFQTSLIREVFYFKDPKNFSHDQEENALRNNRIALSLSREGVSESVIVRTNAMHVALRFAARIYYDFCKPAGGSFLNRGFPIDWDEMWDKTLSDYDQRYGKNEMWSAVYIDGRAMFRTRQDYFMDIIEQCALLAKNEYDEIPTVAESMLKKLGKDIKITYQSLVACVLSDEAGRLRCGTMQRSVVKDSIFNFQMFGGEGQSDRIYHGLMAAAAFLEGLDLKYTIQKRKKQDASGELEKNSWEMRQMYQASERQKTLAKEIERYEGIYDMTYRPDKPFAFTV